jgi:hypothetical protein
MKSKPECPPQDARSFRFETSINDFIIKPWHQHSNMPDANHMGRRRHPNTTVAILALPWPLKAAVHAG